MKERFGKIFTIVQSLLVIILFLLSLFGSIKIGETNVNTFKMISHFSEDYYLGTLSIIVLSSFIVVLIIYFIGVLGAFVKKKSVSNLVLLMGESFLILSLILELISKSYSYIAIALVASGLALNTVGLVYSYVLFFTDKSARHDDASQSKIIRVVSLIINALSIVESLAVFFLPLYKDTENVSIIDGMNSDQLFLKVLYLSFLFVFILNVAIYLSTFKYYFNKDKRYYAKAKISMYFSWLITLGFYVFAMIIFLFKGKESSNAPFIAFLANGGLLIIASIFNSRFLTLPKEKNENHTLLYRTLIILFVLLFSSIIFVSLASNLLTISYETNAISGLSTTTVKIKAYDLIINYSKYGEGYRMLSLVLYLIVLSTIITTVSSIVLYFNKSKSFKQMSMISIVMSFLFVFALELFGRYYRIVQAMNESQLSELLTIFGFTYSSSTTYTISSDITYFFITSCVFLLLILVVKPFSKLDEISEVDVNIKSASGLQESEISQKDKDNIKDDLSTKEEVVSFDPCPQFTELDDELENVIKAHENKLLSQDNDITLPQLTKFIVDYARESRLHLSYSLENIAEFIAGLGATRLSILQGMSGTGKTSLPKIFSEAVLGNCNIVEVESSWKDKNELIGYYNEFSKKFTPKKFTQALYKAKLNEDEITFIVLDEMNLSRIEYYFSDFLSLMENEEDKREIKLLNIKIYKNVEGDAKNYLALENGHTLKIPHNVWFIGTANKDESTFAISDKVYDRANTMNFNKRAPKVKSFTEPIAQKYISYTKFKNLLNDAINSFDFDIESNKIIKQVEEILQPYNISFGNRIYKQIEEFVKIYCSCFLDKEAMLNEAIEKILLNKVVAKLEYKSVENKDELVQKFEALNLHMCSDFVRKLNEDI